MMWWVALVGVVLVVGASPPPLSTFVVALGKPYTSSEQYAAHELAKWVGTAVGGPPLPVTTPDAAKGKPQIAVGFAAASTAKPNVVPSNLGEGGYVMLAGPTLPTNCVVLTGGSGALRGALNAVYSFLHTLGVRFYAPNATDLPSTHPEAPTTLNVVHIPALEYRANNGWAVGHNPDWRVRVHYNQAGDDAHGGGVTYATPPGFVHTSYHLFGDATTGNGQHPPTDMFHTHNAWFWPHDKPSAYGQLCWTNASLIEYLTGRVKYYLQQQPKAAIISVSQNDNQNYCKDPAEMAVIKEEGSPSGPLLRAVNAIAKAIATDYPHVAVDTLAYQYTRPAPKITKPLPNVIIRLCSIECNFAAPLTDASNKAFQTDMVNWSNISQRNYIWNYVTNFANFVQPFPNWWVLEPNVKFFQQHGVKGIFEEGSYPSPGGDMEALKNYVIARSLWEPNTTTSSVIEEFVDGYFGKAGPFVMTYLNVVHQSVVKTKYYMHESFPPTAPFLTPAAMLSSAAAFAQGVSITEGAIRARVDLAKLPVYYVILLRWAEMETYAKAHSIKWPIESTKQDAYNEFTRVYNLTKMTHLSEGGHSLPWFHSQVFPKVD